MKTSKFKFLVPMIAIIFAITTAFSTSVKSDYNAEALSLTTGYVDAPAPCMIPVTCATEGSQICTNGLNGPQAFGKISPSATTCSRILYRPN